MPTHEGCHIFAYIAVAYAVSSMLSKSKQLN